jgi:hypothetical protein
MPGRSAPPCWPSARAEPPVGPTPGRGGRGLVPGAQRVFLVGEAVPGPLVHVEHNVVASPPEVVAQGRDGLRWEEVVIGGQVALDGGGQARPVGCTIAQRRSIEGCGRSHPVTLLSGDQQGEHPAHAEARHPDGISGGRLVGQEEVDGARHVAGGPIGRQRGHELPGPVHLRVLGELAVVEVGGEGHEALTGQAITDPPDLGHQAPPLLEDDHAGSAPSVRQRQVATSRRPVGRELHRLTHGHLPSSPLDRPPMPRT